MTTKRKAATLSLLALLVTASPFATAEPRASAADKIAVHAGRVITMAGPELTDGVIVIEGGRITAVGPASEVEVPWDAEVIEAPDWTAFPGFVGGAHDPRHGPHQ